VKPKNSLKKSRTKSLGRIPVHAATILEEEDYTSINED
jgi:hypothetical protein